MILPGQYQHLKGQPILEFLHAYELIFVLDETLLNCKLFQKLRAEVADYCPIEFVSSTEMKRYDIMFFISKDVQNY